MPPPHSDSPENGWQHIPRDWWRISVNAVSWAYDPSADSDKVDVAKPPRCPPGLFPFQRDDCHEEDETLPSHGDARSLNAELVGLKGALGTLEPYELNVGFHWTPPTADTEEENAVQPDLAASEEHVVQAKEKWDELVQDLTGGLTIDTASADISIESDDDSSLSVYRSTSTHSSIDLTDSDRSVASVPMPSTPRARRSYANVFVKNASPSRSVDSDRSQPRLNAAASIFVPSPPRAKLASGDEPISFPTLNPDRTPTPPSPTLNTNFVFPSLNVVPPIPSVKITKDEQGFYSEVEATPTQPLAHTRSSSATLLPSFLQETFTRRSRSSKTRAMVDKLKSTTASQTQARPQHIQLSSLSKPRLTLSDYGGEGDTPGAEDDSEGWIGGDDASAAKLVAAGAGGSNPKTRRTRELFLALTRRRSNSSPAPAKPTLVDVDLSAEDVGIPVQLPSPDSASTTTSNDNDGWIEGSASTTPAMPDRKPTPLSSSSSQTPERKSMPADPKPPVAQKPFSQRTQKKPKRSTPSVSSNLPPPTHPGPGVYPRAAPPAPHGYYYPHPHPHAPVAVPVPYAAAYIHQMQVLQLQHIQQQQQQHQMHMRRTSAAGRAARAGSGDWRNGAFAVPVPLAAYPMPVAVPVPVPLHNPHPHVQPVFVPHAP